MTIQIEITDKQAEQLRQLLEDLENEKQMFPQSGSHRRDQYKNVLSEIVSQAL